MREIQVNCFHKASFWTVLLKHGKDGSSDKNFRSWVPLGVWSLCSSAKARRNCNQKKLKKWKWSRRGSFCILLLLICKPRLSPPSWVQQTTHRRIHSTWCQFSALETAGLEGDAQDRGDIPRSRRPHGGNSQAPCPGAKCYWKTNIDFWQSLEKFMWVFPRAYELTRNGDKS